MTFKYFQIPTARITFKASDLPESKLITFDEVDNLLENSHHSAFHRGSICRSMLKPNFGRLQNVNIKTVNQVIMSDKELWD